MGVLLFCGKSYPVSIRALKGDKPSAHFGGDKPSAHFGVDQLMNRMSYGATETASFVAQEI